MNNKIEKLLAEREKRSNPPDLLSATFPHQKAFILDPCRRKAAFVARRSGKSTMMGIYLLHIALSNPAVKCLYFGKTQDAARNIMWLHIIFELTEKFHIECKYNKTLQEVVFPNKSMIKLTGADASDTQIEKALGGKYKLVIFDECQVIKHDLERWVRDRLGPAMVDQQGTICMCGTAGDYMGERFWYKVTKTNGVREPGWSVHSWKWFDNIHMKDLIEKEINELKSFTPNIETTDGFRQEWLCEWVENTSSQIYKYNSSTNACKDMTTIKSLTSLPNNEWNYILGVDPGFEDATGFVICAYGKYDPNLYIIESYKIKHMHATAMANEITKLHHKYNFRQMVVDGANKQVVEECRQVHRLPLIPANKLGKVAHWGLMNADFLTSRIKVIEINNKALLEEYATLTYKEDERLLGILKENPTNENHLADAALYAWYYSRHYRAIPKPIEDKTLSQFRIQAEKALEERLAEKTYQLGIYEEMEKL